MRTKLQVNYGEIMEKLENMPPNSTGVFAKSFCRCHRSQDRSVIITPCRRAEE